MTASGQQRRAASMSSESATLATLASTDQVTGAGYPAAVKREVRIVREGTVVALGTYAAYDPGNWLLSTVEKCGSADIGG